MGMGTDVKAEVKGMDKKEVPDFTTARYRFGFYLDCISTATFYAIHGSSV